jgi:hypothetical protein
VELTCTENNSVSSGPGKQTTSLVNGLFLADSLGELLQTEFNALMWWDLRNGQDTGNNNSSSLYGWRLYGDYGIMDSVVPPAASDLYPTYYVGKMLQYFARPGDQVVSVTSDYVGLAAYAVKRANGLLSVLFINKHPSSNLVANVTLSGYTPSANAVLYSYGIPQDNAAQTGNGSADLSQTAVTIPGPTFSTSFGPYSSAVLVVGASLPATPAPPSNLTAKTISKSQINLTWTDNSNNETGFEVDRASNSSFTSGLVTTTVGANVSSYQATSLAGGKTYYFRVRAFNSSGNSSFSNTASATTFRH